MMLQNELLTWLACVPNPRILLHSESNDGLFPGSVSQHSLMIAYLNECVLFFMVSIEIIFIILVCHISRRLNFHRRQLFQSLDSRNKNPTTA